MNSQSGTSKSGAKRRCFAHFDLYMCLAPQRRAIFQQFFDICTSKSGPRVSVFYDFDLKMCLSLQRRAIFRHRNFKKWSAPDSFLAFWLENVLLATAACNFSCVLCRATSAPAALARLLFDPADTQNIEKHSISRLRWSSFLQHCFFNCPYCRKLDF